VNCLCIDVGSTFVKYVVRSRNIVLAEGRERFPEPIFDIGKKYEVPIAGIKTLLEHILELTKGLMPRKCFISVQMHGYVVERSGEISNYISWKDRSGNVLHPILQQYDFWENGTSLKANLPAAKLLVGEISDRYTFYTLGSYIAYLLTGRNITHKTDGCASGFYNAKTLEPIEKSHEIVLPEVTHEIVPVGFYQGMEVFTPIGDHQVSFMGSGADDSGYLLNIGTAAQLSTLGDEWEAKNTVEKRPYFDHRRLLTVTGLSGGEMLYAGYDQDAFIQEVLDAMKKLPVRKSILVGGGGAELIFERLKRKMDSLGIECIKLNHDIGQEGLRMISEQETAKLGVMLSETYFPNFPIILKNEKLDFFIVDNEHGAFDYSFLSTIVMNARLSTVPVIVRLADNQRRDITKFVDMGVDGLLLPMTNRAEDIQKVVDFAKYAPIGRRGLSTNRAHTFYNPPRLEEYMTIANERVKIYAQIETREGVEHIDEILAVPGVEGIFIGPNDLSCDLGCLGGTEKLYPIIKRIAKAVKHHRKRWGIITTSKMLIDCCIENEVDYVSYGSEINMIKDFCRQIRSKVYENK